MKYLIIVAALMLTGCTTTATRTAIDNYQISEKHKQEAVDNALRVANEQMLLSLTQYVKAHPEQAVEAVKATWGARNQLEEIRVQYLLGCTLNQVTVGQYLYDQQGWMNVILEDNSKNLKITSNAIQIADKAAGVTSWKDLIPTTQPATKSVLEQLEDLKSEVPLLHQ